MTITNIITFRQYDPNYGRIIIEVRAADIILENNGQFYKLMSGARLGNWLTIKSKKWRN